MDRGLAYGDGLFETIAVREGQARFLNYHFERLTSSCRRLSMPLPPPEVIRKEVNGLAAECESGTVKILWTRGIGERGYSPPEKPSPNRIVGLLPGDPPPPSAYSEGIVVRYCDTAIGVNPRLAGMKTLGRLDQVLARSESANAGTDEGLMATEDGTVICGTMTNLFHVSDGRLVTPDLTRCGIEGVMRRLVIERAGALGIDCSESNVYPDDLLQASEIFVTNSRIGIWPVVRLESQRLRIGPVTRLLMNALVEIGVTECAG